MDDNAPITLRRPDWAALAIAAGLFVLAIVIAWDASRLGTGGAYARIGPQTVPYAIALCLGGLGIWTVFAAFRHDFPDREEQDLRPIFWIVGGLVAQMVLLKLAGFTIATGILFAMTARGMARVNPLIALGAGILLAGFVWYVFARLLQLSLPGGPVEVAITAIGDPVAGAVATVFGGIKDAVVGAWMSMTGAG